MNFRRMVLLVAVVVLTLPVMANAGAMKAGKWQITMETKMAGMDMKMPPVTIEHCVTPDEAAKPQPPKGKNDSCKTEDYRIDGNTITWKVKCDKPEMTGSGKMTVSAESWEGNTQVKMKDPSSGKSMEMSQKMTGKRVGDCAANDKK